MTVPFRAAVLGSPIAHSRSPQLHLACYALLERNDCTYESIEVAAGNLGTFLAALDSTWMGVSLTMPLKEEALGLVDRVSPDAERIGAVNTICLRPDGRYGYNTDQHGLFTVLQPHLPSRGTAVVLGAGATARSAVAALAACNPAEITVISRDRSRFASLAARFQHIPLSWLPWREDSGSTCSIDADVVVSTVPAQVVNPLTPRPGQYLVDVNYPEPDNLRRWIAAGGRGEDGLTMLVHQGVAQAGLFTGRDLQDPLLGTMVISARAAVLESLRTD